MVKKRKKQSFKVDKKIYLLIGLGILVLIIGLGLRRRKGVKKEEVVPSPEEVSEETLDYVEVELPDVLIKHILDNNGLVFEHCVSLGEPFGEANLYGNSFAFDLNSDGKEEYFWLPWEICGTQVRGASGNGDIFVYGEIEEGWEEIGRIEGEGFWILESKKESYHDLRGHMKSGAEEGETTNYRYFKDRTWPESKYKPVSSENYYCTDEGCK